jgi:hypothetical protein
MDAKDLKAKFLSEMNEYGLYRGGEDNPILFTMEGYVILKELGLFTWGDEIRLAKSLDALLRKVNGLPIYGLYNRRPKEDNRTQHHDDYVGIVASTYLSKLFQWDAWDVCKYGRMNFYSYNNVEPYKYALRSQRQPFDIMLYRIAANVNIGLIGLIGLIHYYFKILLYFKQDPSDTSSKMLDWLRLKTMGHKWYIKPAKWIFNKMLTRKYKNGFLDVIDIYHRRGLLYEMFKLLPNTKTI